MVVLTPRALLRDVGNRVVGQGDERVRRPVTSAYRRTRRARLGPPQPQVLENTPDEARVVDQGDDSHGPPALRMASTRYLTSRKNRLAAERKKARPAVSATRINIRGIAHKV